MTTQLTITTRDLRRLAAATDRGHLQGPCDPMPVSLLLALADLVPCDDVTYAVQNPSRKEYRVTQQVSPGDPGEPEDDSLEPLYWQMFLATPWNPYRTGDYVTVRRTRDTQASKEFESRTGAAYHRLIGMRHLVTVPLPPRGDADHRLMLWRADGRDFSDREAALLALLRPHLVAIHAEVLRRDSGAALLTERQLQLLRLVAAGATNRQVARRLSLSEATVRRHLENVYQRLDVTSRTGAVARAFPADVGA